MKYLRYYESINYESIVNTNIETKISDLITDLKDKGFDVSFDKSMFPDKYRYVSISISSKNKSNTIFLESDPFTYNGIKEEIDSLINYMKNYVIEDQKYGYILYDVLVGKYNSSGNSMSLRNRDDSELLDFSKLNDSIKIQNIHLAFEIREKK